MSDRSDRDRVNRFNVNWTTLCQAAGVDFAELTAALQRGDGESYQRLARQVMESPAAFNAGLRSIRRMPSTMAPSPAGNPQNSIRQAID